VTAESQPNQPLDPASRDALKAQLTEARDFALRYPTVADATGAGYRLAGGFAPGRVGAGGVVSMTGSSTVEGRVISAVMAGTSSQVGDLF